MKYGMPTLIELKSLEGNIKLCKKLGLNFIELNMNLPFCIPENLHPKYLKQLKKKYEIDFTIHLPEELDLTSFQPSIREGHLKRCLEIIKWAHISEIKILNMHLNKGIYFTLPNTKKWINEEYESQFLHLLTESFSQLYNDANSMGVIVCIENTCNFQLPFIQKALKQLAISDPFALTWDTGHDAKTDYNEKPVLMQFKDQIKHMHLHDYNGVSDHQTLYSGSIPIDERLDFAKENGLSVVIEVKTVQSLVESVKRLNVHRKLKI
ncbi:sugar phosphate isomerase/epimerase family protein [Chengkuizengella axinellae]|uniref:TIM barrel protein n=1 Tax=Chengkuizengella axinellae TaxID=3064388 RepID=A0ABT9IWX6_9BACL|nr:TIM barrel protein [Chengkuizengella sp. 2205SS18-9]MDP5273861.1 TIM barrel protein [Chengkuizengella sp. 2205SS18-9]